MQKLNQTFFYTLEKSIRLYRHYCQDQFKQHGFQITLDQWITLNMLVEFPEASQMEIAQKVFKDKASITRIIELLVRDDYLLRNKNTADFRKSRFTLTKKGEETVSKINELIVQIRTSALEGLPENEVRSVMHFIQKLENNCVASF
ncbi:MAG: MarR family winged helix-turn-helix transcriptional regulator [Flavobacteriaceae bacterium]